MQRKHKYLLLLAAALVAAVSLLLVSVAVGQWTLPPQEVTDSEGNLYICPGYYTDTESLSITYTLQCQECIDRFLDDDFYRLPELPTATPTITPTATITGTPTITPTATPTVTVTPTATPVITETEFYYVIASSTGEDMIEEAWYTTTGVRWDAHGVGEDNHYVIYIELQGTYTDDPDDTFKFRLLPNVNNNTLYDAVCNVDGTIYQTFTPVELRVEPLTGTIDFHCFVHIEGQDPYNSYDSISLSSFGYAVINATARWSGSAWSEPEPTPTPTMTPTPTLTPTPTITPVNVIDCTLPEYGGDGSGDDILETIPGDCEVFIQGSEETLLGLLLTWPTVELCWDYVPAPELPEPFDFVNLFDMGFALVIILIFYTRFIKG